MSEARKCDRCGAFFDDFENARNVVFSKFGKPWEDNFDRNAELCPECFGKLEKWLKDEVER